MLFNSLDFLIFLPLVFLLYWYVFQYNFRIQNLFIVIVSYIFYGWWDWRFLLLIAFTSFLSWLSGVTINYVRRKVINRRKESCISRMIMIANVVILSLIHI